MKAFVAYLLSGKVFCGNPACKGCYSGTSFLKSVKRYSYYRCINKCGNVGVNKDELEQMVINQVSERCFSEDAMNKIVDKIKIMYSEKQTRSYNEVQPIKAEIAELEIKINNWTEAVGSGAKSFIEKVVAAEQRKDALEYELGKIDIVQKVPAIDEGKLREILIQKKNDLLSEDESKRKAVLQECVDRVTILHTKDKMSVDLTIRYFGDAGEAALLIYLQLIVNR